MLCWNVYYGNFNSREIEVVNVFDHGGFYNDCVKAKKKFKEDKEGFADEVRRSLHYYFWSKCEWEIILSHWPSGELYEMQKELKVGELRKALQDAGVEYDTPARPWIKDDTSVTIHVFPEYCKDRDLKIDVCQQVMNNWDIFIDYLWEHRRELKARK